VNTRMAGDQNCHRYSWTRRLRAHAYAARKKRAAPPQRGSLAGDSYAASSGSSLSLPAQHAAARPRRSTVAERHRILGAAHLSLITFPALLIAL
jgi:hypothetical protein